MYYSSPSDNVREENRKSSYSKVFSSLNSIFPDEKKSHYKDPFMSDYEGENFKKGTVLINVFVFRKYFRNEESGRLGGSPGDRPGAGHRLPRDWGGERDEEHQHGEETGQQHRTLRALQQTLQPGQ